MIGQDHNPSIFKHDSSDFSIFDSSPQNEDSESIEDLLLDQSRQWPSAIDRRVSRCCQVVFDFICATYLNLAVVLLHSLLNFLDSEIHNLPDLPPCQSVEDDDGADAVEEFWEEVVPQSIHDLLPGAWVDFAVPSEWCAVQRVRTKIARHNHDTISGIDDSSLAVCDASVVH